ncbi:MAG: ATP-grasp domain-containing protein [Bacteroidota bacterium]
MKKYLLLLLFVPTNTLSSGKKKEVIVLTQDPEVDIHDPLSFGNEERRNKYNVTYICVTECRFVTLREKFKEKKIYEPQVFYTSFIGSCFNFSIFESLKKMRKKFDYLVVFPQEQYISRAGDLREVLEIKNGMNRRESDYYVNKKEMKERLRHSSVPTVPFVSNISSNTWSKLKAQKVVLKPINDSGSNGIFIANNEDEFNNELKGKYTEMYIAEKYMSGDIYNIDGIVQNGKRIVTLPTKSIGNCFSFYQENQPKGLITVTDKETKEELEKLADGFLRMGNKKEFVHKDGFYHIEIIADKNGKLYIMEGAARESGSHYKDLLKRKFGFSLIQAGYKAQLHEEIDPNEKALKQVNNLPNNKRTHGVITLPFPLKGEKIASEEKKNYTMTKISDIHELNNKYYQNSKDKNDIEFIGINFHNHLEEGEEIPKPGFKFSPNSQDFNVSILFSAANSKKAEDYAEYIASSFKMEAEDPQGNKAPQRTRKNSDEEIGTKTQDIKEKTDGEVGTKTQDIKEKTDEEAAQKSSNNIFSWGNGLKVGSFFCMFGMIYIMVEYLKKRKANLHIQNWLRNKDREKGLGKISG